MSKRKKKKQKLNQQKVSNMQTVKIVTNEIDYGKMAEAIVHAQNKNDEKYSVTKEWMKFMLYFFMVISILLCFLLSVRFVYNVVCIAKELEDSLSIKYSFKEYLSIIFEFLINSFGFLAFLNIGGFTVSATIDIAREKNNDVVSAFFQNYIGFIALLISLIALFR